MWSLNITNKATTDIKVNYYSILIDYIIYKNIINMSLNLKFTYLLLNVLL